jgi:protein TonB
MAEKLLDPGQRTVGVAGALALHGLAVALLILLPPSLPSPAAPEARLVAVRLTEPPPPPPPPPPAQAPQAPAPPSRGADAPPSVPLQPRPLQSPSPAEPSVDAGPGLASGAGTGAGSGAGLGGDGSGSGGGAATPPQRIAGELTNADYSRARPPSGAAGTVLVEFRVRTDGRADSCRVMRSSGFAVFDQATCRLIEQRFRFRPARDAAGRAIDWQIRTDYTWAPR